METLNVLPAAAMPAAARIKSGNVPYWIVTGLVAAAMLMDGIAGVLRVEGGRDVMAHLGYPMYMLSIMGTAKILGALALVQPTFRTLKEWAYAGFTINFVSAAASWAFTDHNLTGSIAPGIALALLFGSYFLWKRKERMRIV